MNSIVGTHFQRFFVFRVTKRTIVHFADGPRVVLPPGIWGPQNTGACELKRGWTPSSYHHLYNPNGKRDGQEATDSKEKETRSVSSPKKVEKKKPEMEKTLKTKESLHSIVDRLVENHGKTK